MSLSLKKWNKLTWRQPVALAIAICLTSLVPQTVYGQTDTGDQGTPEPTPTAPTQTGITVHVVQAGETLDQIAASYGILPDALQQANGLESLDDLAIGQRLVIPSSDVVRGTETALVANLEDSLYVLSARYQVPVEDLGLMNRIVNPTRLVAGQNLIAENDRGRALAVVRSKERQSWLGVAVANELNPWALRLMNPGLDIILPFKPRNYKCLLNSRVQLLGRQPIRCSIEVQVLADSQVVIQAKFLGHITNPGTNFGRITINFHIQDNNRACCGLQKSQHHADGGGFSGTVWSKKTKDLPALYIKTNSIHSGKISKVFGKVFDENGWLLRCHINPAPF